MVSFSFKPMPSSVNPTAIFNKLRTLSRTLGGSIKPTVSHTARGETSYSTISTLKEQMTFEMVSSAEITNAVFIQL